MILSQKNDGSEEDTVAYIVGPSVFFFAFVIRCASAVITTFTTLNPDSRGDAVGFGNTAKAIAHGLAEGQPYLYTTGAVDISQILIPTSSVDVYQLWGSFLAPFWLLPGPSGFYARLGNAFLGAIAVYNIYLLGRHYHSPQAGVVATLPLIFYPSIVAIHSTLLREAVILFGITTAVRLVLLPLKRCSRLVNYVLAGALLHIAVLLRDDNILIYVSAFAAALVIYAAQSGYVSKRQLGVGIIFTPVVAVISYPIIRSGVKFLARTRMLRASGRAVYLGEIVPRTVAEFVAFSWIGAAYFLYAPFPWMIETIPDLLVSLEGIVTFGFTVAALWGIRSVGKNHASATVGPLAGLIIAVVLYGIGTANYGTAMRHRQMFIWVIFLFGGVGITEHVTFTWPFQSNSGQRSSRPDTGRPDSD